MIINNDIVYDRIWYLIFKHDLTICKILENDKIFRHIVKKYFPEIKDNTLLQICLEEDNLEMLLKYELINEYVCSEASTYEAIDILKYAHKHEYEWCCSTPVNAGGIWSS